MATITTELRLPTGQKTRPSDINADDAAEDFVLTAKPDGSGGFETQFAAAATDPGIALGTPGNGSLTMWTGELIIAAVPAAATRPTEYNAAPKSHNFGSVGAIRVQTVVTQAGPSGAKLAVRGLPFLLGSWGYLDGASGPFVAIDAVNASDGVPIASVGDWVDVDATYQIDNLNIELVTVGGDGATEAIIGNVYVDFLSVAASVPPESGTPTPPDVPTTSPTLLADWDPTEGSGGTLADKS